MLFNAVLPAVDGAKPVPRSGFGPRLIYVVGGSGEGGRLSTVELYDPQNASWTQVVSMADPRVAHGCVALAGKLYAVGGLWSLNSGARHGGGVRPADRWLAASGQDDH